MTYIKIKEEFFFLFFRTPYHSIGAWTSNSVLKMFFKINLLSITELKAPPGPAGLLKFETKNVHNCQSLASQGALF